MQLSREKEEAERRELQRMLKGEPSDAKDKKIGKGSKEDEMMVSMDFLTFIWQNIYMFAILYILHLQV